MPFFIFRTARSSYPCRQRAQGRVSFDEWLNWMISRMIESQEAHLQELFVKLDLDGDGFITITELQTCTGLRGGFVAGGDGRSR
jgi:Ca2+-binding EF-hand superfamily protein